MFIHLILQFLSLLHLLVFLAHSPDGVEYLTFMPFAWSSKSAFSPELPLLHHKSYLFLWGLCCWCCWGHLIISVYFIVLHCFCVILESPWLSFFQLSFSSSLASFLGTALAVGFEKVKENFIIMNIAFQYLG